MVVVYFYLYLRLPTSFRFIDPFFSIDLHTLNTRAIAERFGNKNLATGTDEISRVGVPRELYFPL